MEKFLEVVYNEHISEPEIGNKSYDEFYKPFFEKLEEIISPKLYNELEELFTSCNINNTIYYGVEGMKLAIAIMEKKYVPKI